MMRRASITAVIALGITALVAQTPAYHRAVSSTHTFQRYLRDLKGSGALNPVERFVFSLLLANSSPDKAISAHS